MIQDHLQKTDRKRNNTYILFWFRSQFFNTSQLKKSADFKEFRLLHFALELFAPFVWRAEKAVIFLTDNKSLIFFSIKISPFPFMEHHW